MHERRLGDYCPTPSPSRDYYTAELHHCGAATSVAGVDKDGNRFGSPEALRLLEMKVVPPKYFTFDVNGKGATLHLEWHGMRFSRWRPIESMRNDLRLMAPELLEMFDASLDAVKWSFIPDAQPMTTDEIADALRDT